MILQTKLEARQLTLGRFVDLGTELAVMALVAARVQGNIDKGASEDVERGLYWLAEGRNRVDRLFCELTHNNDDGACRLSRKLMDEAELLDEVDTSHLSPIAHDKGSDLTTGRQTCRGEEPTSSGDRRKAS